MAIGCAQGIEVLDDGYVFVTGRFEEPIIKGAKTLHPAKLTKFYMNTPMW